MKTVHEVMDEPEPTLKPTPLARIADALERVADALEEKVKPKIEKVSEKVIRVKITEFGSVVTMLLAAHPYVIGSGAEPVGGQPGLFHDPDDPYRFIYAHDTVLRHEIEVRAAAFKTTPLSETLGEYLVTVNVQPDFETWNWRDWRKM